MCTHSGGLLARTIEAGGIPTITLAVFEEVARNVNPPRALILPHPRGATLGEPKNRDMQSRVLKKAFSMLETATHGGTVERYDTGWG